MKLTVFIHLYYENTALNIYSRLKHIIDVFNGNIYFLINLPLNHPKKDVIIRLCENKLPNCTVIQTSNIGKDIGGKLALMHLYLKKDYDSELLLFLHDKKSPQTAVGDTWSNQLYEMTSESGIAKTLNLFSSSNVGMVGNQELLFNKKNRSEDEIFVENKNNVLRIADKYNLTSHDYGFVGGTMFWVRESIFKNFFIDNPPLSIRSTLEKGNVLDDFGPTLTHSWERLFGWIITSAGYCIKGV